MPHSIKIDFCDLNPMCKCDFCKNWLEEKFLLEADLCHESVKPDIFEGAAFVHENHDHERIGVLFVHQMRSDQIKYFPIFQLIFSFKYLLLINKQKKIIIINYKQ